MLLTAQMFSLIALMMSVVIAQTGVPVCYNQTHVINSTVNEADFLFLLDASISMDGEIAGVSSGFNSFAALITRFNISARFGVVRFGGFPTIFLPFTSNLTDLSTAVSAVLATVGSGAQESSLEAVRASLPPENGTALTRRCAAKYANQCTFNWRPNALKVLILATDEDSDLPHIAKYRGTGQNSTSSFCASPTATPNTCLGGRFEPSFIPSIPCSRFNVAANKTEWIMCRTSPVFSLTPGYEEEIQMTADAIIKNRAFTNFIVSPGGMGIYGTGNPYWQQLAGSNRTFPRNNTVTSTYQYGHPLLQVHNTTTFTNFNPAGTLELHRSYGLQNSLQSRVLAAGGFMRVFPISPFSFGVNPMVIQQFYTQVIRTTNSITQFCTYPDAPASITDIPPPDDPTDVDLRDDLIQTPEDPDPTVVIVPPPSQESDKSTGDKIKDTVKDITDKIVEQYNNITASETNVALILTSLGIVFGAIVLTSVAAYRNRNRLFALFKGKAFDKAAGLSLNPLYSGVESTRENPLYQSTGSVAEPATSSTKAL